MAKFFVGQRVRIINVTDAFEALGKEGTITEWHDECQCWCVSVDGIGEWNGDKWYGFDSEDLEPILPEGAQPSEFSFTELMDNLGVVVA